MPAVNLHVTYLKMAKVYSEMSYAKRKKVAAIVVKDGRIISTGYNGMPAGFDNECESFSKSTQFSPQTKPEVIHAEANAILFAAKNGQSTNDCVLYLTMSPCVECAKMIIQSGIKSVHYLENYRDASGVHLLTKANISVKYYEKV